MRHTEVIVLLLQWFTVLLQHAMASEFRNARYRSSYTGDLKEKEKTVMDTIMDINNYEVVAKDGVKLRQSDIAVSGKSQKSCFAQSCLWPKAVDGYVYIAYTLSTKYTKVDHRTIKQGMDLIERDTCVRFVPRTHQTDFLDIQPKSGCWSYLGLSGGKQTVSLQSPECVSSGVVSHQLMHVLGFVHEQSRIDRDKYINIIWSKVWKDHMRNFEKFKMNNIDMPYDYGSIMHFGRYAFSEDGDPTIVPKRSWNSKLGQRFGPSKLDVMKINKLYKCNY